ncbi:hypothetical protein CBL_00209 [Carabus blaptoides fortunei]
MNGRLGTMPNTRWHLYRSLTWPTEALSFSVRCWLPIEGHTYTNGKVWHGCRREYMESYMPQIRCAHGRGRPREQCNWVYMGVAFFAGDFVFIYQRTTQNLPSLSQRVECEILLHTWCKDRPVNGTS